MGDTLKKAYDLYGLSFESLDQAKRAVECLLDITLQAHESGYRGGEYFRLSDVGNEHFILQRNCDGLENACNESGKRNVQYLLYVNETKRSEEIMTKLKNDSRIRLIDHKLL